MVNGCSSKRGIADTFKDSFQKNSTPNNAEKVQDLNTKFSKSYEDYVNSHKDSCDCKAVYITLLNWRFSIARKKVICSFWVIKKPEMNIFFSL